MLIYNYCMMSRQGDISTHTHTTSFLCLLCTLLFSIINTLLICYHPQWSPPSVPLLLSFYIILHHLLQRPLSCQLTHSKPLHHLIYSHHPQFPACAHLKTSRLLQVDPQGDVKPEDLAHSLVRTQSCALWSSNQMAALTLL